MKILIVTPLYPPDIAGSAPYVKELASRLKEVHSVTVLAYNHIPEAIEGVQIIPIEKSNILPLRLIRFFNTLLQEMQNVDIVFLENGPSVELPFFFAHLMRNRKMLFHLGDQTALTHTEKSIWYRIPFLCARMRAVRVLTPANFSVPPPRPEILPFKAYPSEEMRTYETAWTSHIKELNNIFETI
jgi:glycosyltransferase involved in cell wall biosynthesis